jgi:hypothetical protein
MGRISPWSAGATGFVTFDIETFLQNVFLGFACGQGWPEPRDRDSRDFIFS